MKFVEGGAASAARMVGTSAEGRRSPPPPALAAALGYAALGLRVVPLRKQSKRPVMEGWTRHASWDPRVVTPWIASRHDCNVGIATGRSLLALDVDPRNGGRESLKELRRIALPFTAHARTGSGGDHYLFRYDPEFRVMNKILMPGIDIKGDGGMIVAEPSIHPDSGREYTWLVHPSQGIVELPTRLARRLIEDGIMLPAVAGGPQDYPRRPIEAVRSGDAGDLLAEMIDRFPVDGFCQRNDQMVRVLASLLGRELTPDLAYAVTEAWWRHFHALGLIRTPPGEARRLIGASIRSILRSPTFLKGGGKADHRAACALIRLGPDQERLLDARLEDLGDLLNPHPGRTPLRLREDQDRRGITKIGDRLCISDQERAFVEALIVLVTHERATSRDGVIRMTGDQIRAIMADRHQGIRPLNSQMDRLKSEYISRPGRPATRMELLRETRRGRRGRGESVGTPSEYEATGIELLLDREVRRSQSGPARSAA
jgi:hypothetical protein